MPRRLPGPVEGFRAGTSIVGAPTATYMYIHTLQQTADALASTVDLDPGEDQRCGLGRPKLVPSCSLPLLRLSICP